MIIINYLFAGGEWEAASFAASVERFAINCLAKFVENFADEWFRPSEEGESASVSRLPPLMVILHLLERWNTKSSLYLAIRVMNSAPV